MLFVILRSAGFTEDPTVISLYERCYVNNVRLIDRYINIQTLSLISDRLQLVL